MNTFFLVMAEFESVEIPLEKICDRFGLKLPQAKREAAGHELPVPFYKNTPKGGYFCNATDWARYLDSNATAARNEWEKMNNHSQGAQS
jgi:hypothetical protein